MKNHTPQSLGGQVWAKIQRQKAIDNYYQNPNYCKQCSCLIQVRNLEKVSEVRKRKFCNHSCAAKFNNLGRASKTKKIKIFKPKPERFKYLNKLTKGQLFAKSKNWQSARSIIARHARFIYRASKLSYRCKVCNYSCHVNISHIKDVRKFNNNEFITEINNINNLVALCPNHHWEFDHGVLDLS